MNFVLTWGFVLLSLNLVPNKKHFPTQKKGVFPNNKIKNRKTIGLVDQVGPYSICESCFHQAHKIGIAVEFFVEITWFVLQTVTVENQPRQTDSYGDPCQCRWFVMTDTVCRSEARNTGNSHRFCHGMLVSDASVNTRRMVQKLIN